MRYWAGRAVVRLWLQFTTPKRGSTTPLGVMWLHANCAIAMAVVHDYDMMRLSVAFYLIGTATVLSPPTSTCDQ